MLCGGLYVRDADEMLTLVEYRAHHLAITLRPEPRLKCTYASLSVLPHRLHTASEEFALFQFREPDGNHMSRLQTETYGPSLVLPFTSCL